MTYDFGFMIFLSIPQNQKTLYSKEGRVKISRFFNVFAVSTYPKPLELALPGIWMSRCQKKCRQSRLG